MPNVRDFKRALQSKLDRKVDITVPFRAVLCDSTGLTSGSGSVWANQNTRMVWYLPIGGGQPAQVRCMRLPPVLGLGVIIGYVDGSVELEVLSDDPFLRNGNTTGESWLTVSPADFQPGGKLQLWLYSKLFVPLAVYPGNGLSVSVAPGDYEGADGTRKTFGGQNNFSIAAHQPAGPNEHLLVGISLDTSGALQATAGAVVSTVLAAPEPAWPADSVRLAVVDLDDTQTTLNLAADISDRRLHFSYPGSGAILASFFAAKGDLLTATADDTPAILTVGTDGQHLIADSAQPEGIDWSNVVDLNGVADALIIDADGDTTISAPTDDEIDIEVGGADIAEFKAGGLYLAAVGDVYPGGDANGLWNRIVNYSIDPAEHWRQGADELAWTGWAAYTNHITPNTITRAGSQLQVSDTASTGRLFYYRSFNNAETNLYALCHAGLGCESGLQVDNGVDHDANGAQSFVRWFIEWPAAANNANLAVESRTAGGAITKNTFLSLPPSDMYAIRLRYGIGTRWSSWSAFVYVGVKNLTPGALAFNFTFLALVSGLNWTPVRHGLYGNEGVANRSITWDWFDE